MVWRFSGTGVFHFLGQHYKLGLEWAVNDDVRLRASLSRDMRAPTLWDSTSNKITSSGTMPTHASPDSSCPQAPTPWASNQNGSVNTVTGGNPTLKPETSNNTTMGVVFTPRLIQVRRRRLTITM